MIRGHFTRKNYDFKSKFRIFFLLFISAYLPYSGANLPPYFTGDLNNHVIPENTPVGTAIYKLEGLDPENSSIKYGIMGTDKLVVDEKTGVVTVAKPIDREVTNQLRVTVTVEDVVDDGRENNLVTVPVTVQILDENDNPPQFQNQSSFESLEVNEETRVGSKILSITVRDPDLTGFALSLNCTPSLQSPEACLVFALEIREASSGILRGDLRLGHKLDYNKRSLYQFILTANDGEHSSSAEVLIRVKDVQNSPPIFTGPMSGRVSEDTPVGSLIMVLQARDGDLGRPRPIRMSLLTNPGDSFQLDGKTGHLTTTRPLDREILGSYLNLEVKAVEVPKSEEFEALTNSDDFDLLTTHANVTILINDVNDFAPKFNQKEFFTSLHENTAHGTPLQDLDIQVTDLDSGAFADFTLRIEGPLSDLFDIEPKRASGNAKPVIRVKKSFDYENPNERKFLILIVAQNEEEPGLFSTCTISVAVIDENDNRPKFAKDVFSISVPENLEPGVRIGSIVATDPDSNEFGNDGIIYTLVGSGNKKFSINQKNGDIFIAECQNVNNNNNTIMAQSCLDYETQKTYDLLYMASDNYKKEGFIHSIVPLQILLEDSNDNSPYFDKKFTRSILENAIQFEPRFFITAKDPDKTSVLSYNILNSNSIPYFKVDPNTGELTIKSNILPPGNYSFVVEANDSLFKTTSPVNIFVSDINNHAPVFDEDITRHVEMGKHDEVGTLITSVTATDSDLEENGHVSYSLDKGGYGYFEIDEESGAVILSKEIGDSETKKEFQLLVTAQDSGAPPLRTSTTITVIVVDPYVKIPQIFPKIQRAQISESARVGELVTKISLNTSSESEEENQELIYEFIMPVDARNPDNKMVDDITLFQNWFRIDNEGRVIVTSPLERDLVTTIRFTVMVTSPNAKPGTRSLGTLVLTVFEVNDLPPKIEDMEVETYEELPIGTTIVNSYAEDPEGGQISTYFIQEGKEFFTIDNKTGDIKVAGRLDFEDRPIVNLTVVAVDSGVPQLSSTATIMLTLLNINDNTPIFNQTEYVAEVKEHSQEGTIVTSVAATDLDGDVIFYEIEQSAFSSAFKIDRLGQITVTKEGTIVLDREIREVVSVTVKAKDSSKSGARIGYSVVRVNILDVNDNWPHFNEKNYHVVAHAPLRSAQELIKLTANGGDTEETDFIRYKIVSGNELGIFEVDKSSGIVKAGRAFEKSGEFRLVIQVTDKGEDSKNETEHFDRTGLFIQILPGNFKKPEFLFPNKINSTLIAIESNEEEIKLFSGSETHSKILGQLMAFDPDEGEAGKIKFYFKESDNLVTETDEFKVETDTGKIHQIRPLDREKQNRYYLVVVAKDGGTPVSTENQQLLTIEVEDIDDHQPTFVQRSYSFTIKENTLENTFIGQVKAVDADEGKYAEIFYFLVSEEKNKYINRDIRVEIKTGMIHSNAMLDRERINHYRLFIRASSTPLQNRSSEVVTLEEGLSDSSLVLVNIQVLDENDNGPRFSKKLYYAGINSEAEPGREILTFDSTDVDPSSQNFIQYSLLGANLILDDFKSGGSVVPSPFRVDSGSGRLTISPAAMRAYSGGNNRFMVKVGVKETIPPYHHDSTNVQVWVVESSQEAILTVKSPPNQMLKEELINILSNVTSSLVLINKLTPHLAEDMTVNKEWTDVYVSSVDKRTSQILPIGQFLHSLDAGHDSLRQADCPIELYSAVPALGATDPDGEYFFNVRENFDSAFAGLIALVALLCMALAAILAVCCCITRMRSDKDEKQFGGMKYPLHFNGTGSIPGTPALARSGLIGLQQHQQPDMIEDLATDNPLWIDHKIKTYEEQELTMQVASELDHSNGSIDDGMSLRNGHGLILPPPRQQQSPQFSHAYATLHPHPTDYDNILGEDTLAVHL